MTESSETPNLSVEEARALHLEGRLDEAEQAYRRIIADDPASAEAIHLAGVLSLQRGRPKDGLALTSRAVRLDGRQPRYHNSLGNAQMVAGRPGEAAESFGNALAIDPEFTEARFNLACALQSQGKAIEAERGYRQTLERTPGHAGAMVNLAALLQAAGRADEAGGWLERAVKAAPDSLEALWNLGNLREGQDRLGEAETAVARLLEAAPGHVPGLVLEARLMRRRGRLDDALVQLKRLLSGQMPEPSAIEALFEMGLVYDALDKPWLAFEAFEQGNVRRAATPGYQAADASRFVAQVRDNHAYFTAERLAALAEIGGAAAKDADPARGPVFLVGFPQSGESLLAAMLSGHSGLAVSGTPLAAARARLASEAGDGPAYPMHLDALTPELAAACRNAFFEAAGDAGRPLDVQPLNIIDLGLINAILPDATVVMAMRDPRDVALNCFMTRFRPSDAMASFTGIAGTVALYAEVMQLWRHYAETLALPIHTVRYEALREDPEASLRSVLDAIGLPWEGALLNSAAPDSGPAGRWRRYRGLLEPVTATLAPFAEAFGYDPA
jgi:tetratricopeptide (TPR) repeat protein